MYLPIAQMRRLLKKGRLNRGAYFVIEAVVKGERVRALIWNDHHAKAFIFMTGDSIRGMPSLKRRQDEFFNTYNSEIVCPKILGQGYYPYFGSVDQSNRQAIDLFGLQHSWHVVGFVKSYHRFFMERLVINAYNAQKAFRPDHNPKVRDGVLELINDWLGGEPAPRPGAPAPMAAGAALQPINNNSLCRLVPNVVQQPTHGRHVRAKRRRTRPETARPETQAFAPRPAWGVLGVSSRRATPRSKRQVTGYAMDASAAGRAPSQ
eukprot:COSAG05_NODE_1066_length_5973_cov_116.687606_5_plen_263_part_00